MNEKVKQYSFFGLPKRVYDLKNKETLELGKTATTASAGNRDHAVVEGVASGLAAASTIQKLAIALSARIKALEDAV